ncbi:hypothetical protein [Thalassobius sp. Cn5-15]|uniref:hypothetical protein n=1 Tax=Thalassobius sp. Cn5-15 TaxID=2917763 RepID=UPI001EF30F07|nr:hypothetical protein [Thalassobius sp. Cn5-15]MCG7492453.1 hypothetical protein [Thalassobius sp. Cn5-15]
MASRAKRGVRGMISATKTARAKVEVEGHMFESHFEAERYFQLRRKEKRGQIAFLRVKQPHAFVFLGRKLWDYCPTFKYQIMDEETGQPVETVVEEVTEPFIQAKPWLDPKIKAFEAQTGLTVKLRRHSDFTNRSERFKRLRRDVDDTMRLNRYE